MLVFEKLEPAVHNRQQFSCGNKELDVFLKNTQHKIKELVNQQLTFWLIQKEEKKF